VEELGGEGREGKKGGGEGVGAPFNVLPQGATDVVAPLGVWHYPATVTKPIRNKDTAVYTFSISYLSSALHTLVRFVL